MRRFNIGSMWVLLAIGALASGIGEAQGQSKKVKRVKPSLKVVDAYLRFSQPLYEPGDCAQLSLTVSQQSAALMKSGPPSVEISTPGPGPATGKVAIKMHPLANGVYVLPACVRLTSDAAASNDHLPVQPGTVLVAIARSSSSVRLAAALAVVPPEKGAGKVQFTVDPGTKIKGTSTLTNGDSKKITFLSNQVIVAEHDSGEFKRFLVRRHGRIVSTIGRHHLVEVDVTTAHTAHLEPLAEMLGMPAGKYHFSSTAALQLGTLVLEELVGGLPISLDLSGTANGQPQTKEGAGLSQFTADWFNPNSPPTSNVRLSEGMAMARIFPGTFPPVTIAFVDGGFAGPNDYSPAKPSVISDFGFDPSVSDFKDIPQCRAGTTDTSCSWETLNPEAAGPGNSSNLWHGTSVATLAVARWNDSEGIAGVGFPATPYLIAIGINELFSAHRGIEQVLAGPPAPKARILSLSFGFNCVQDLKLFSADFCSSTEDAIFALIGCAISQATLCVEIAALVKWGVNLDVYSSAISDVTDAGVLVIAAAPDDGTDDADAAHSIPCTVPHVICVGGLNADLTRFAAKGDSVFIYAPASSIRGTETPSDVPGLPPILVGTSFSSPILSGAVALALSISPALNEDAVRKLLRNSSCRSSHTLRMDGSTCVPSTDPDVDKVGYLDLLEFLRQARQQAGKNPLVACTGGWDAEEAADKTDDFQSAIPLPPLKPITLDETEFKPAKRDLSIHTITLGKADEDWYSVQFNHAPFVLVKGYQGKFSFKVDDPSLGVLALELWEEDKCGGPPIRVPQNEVASTLNSQSGDGEASVTALIRSDVKYFMRVFGRDSLKGGNCYNNVHVLVRQVDHLPVIPRSDPNCSIK